MTPEEDERLGEILNQGMLAMGQFYHTRNKLHLTRAFEIWTRLDRIAPAHWKGRFALNANLGIASREMAMLSRDEWLCSQSIQKFNSVLASPQITGEVRRKFLNEIAMSYTAASDFTPNLENTEAAIKATRQAIAAHPSGHPYLLGLQNQVGSLLAKRFGFTGNKADIEEAFSTLYESRKANTTEFSSQKNAELVYRKTALKLIRSQPSSATTVKLAEVAESEFSNTTYDSESRAEWMEVLAWCLFSTFEADGDMAKRQRALKLTGERVDLLGKSGRNRGLERFLPAIQKMSPELRNDLFRIMIKHPSPSDMDAAINANRSLREALFSGGKLPNDFQVRWARAIDLVGKYEKNSDQKLIEEAVSILSELILVPGFKNTQPAFRSQVLDTATKASWQYYWCTGSLERLQMTLNLAREAHLDAMDFKRTVLDAKQESLVDRGFLIQMVIGIPLTAHTLCLVLSELYLRTQNLEMLDEAIEFGQKSIELFTISITDKELPLFHGSLGTAFRYRFDCSKNPHDIETSVRHHEQATNLERTRIGHSSKWQIKDGEMVKKPDGPESVVHLLNNLASALRQRFRFSHHKIDLDNAIKFHREALSLCSVKEPSHALFIRNLFSDLVLVTNSPTAEKEIEQVCSMADSLETAPANHLLELHLDIGRWAFRHAKWERAASSLRKLQEARKKVLSFQKDVISKQNWLAITQGLTAQQAYSWAKCGNLESAVKAFEGGLASFVMEGLRWSEVQLTRIESLAPDLVLKAKQARTAIGVLDFSHRQETPLEGGLSRVQDAAVHEKAWLAYQEVEKKLIDLVGIEAWTLETSLARIQQELKRLRTKAAVIYLATTHYGSVGVVVSDSSVKAIWPHLKESDLINVMHGKQHDGKSLLEWFSESGSGIDTALQIALPTIGEKLARPIFEVISTLGAEHIFIIPCGVLSLFPIHAASWTEANRKQALLDSHVVSYLPNATVGIVSHNGALGRTLLKYKFVGFGNPTPSKAMPLPGAELEVNKIQELLNLRDSKVMCGPQATKAEFILSQSDASIVHFAGHGVFVPQDPTSSHLIFSNDEKVTVGEFLSPEFKTARGAIAVLSACQTAQVDFDNLPDESLGLPASLLVAGFQSVVGTLWPVSDKVTALLMIAFYENLMKQSETLDPALALQKAVSWLKSSEGKHLNDFIKAHHLQLKPFPDSIQMEHHPAFWAGFVHVGI